MTDHWYIAGSEQIPSTDGEISILNKHITEEKKERGRRRRTGPQKTYRETKGNMGGERWCCYFIVKMKINISFSSSLI